MAKEPKDNVPASSIVMKAIDASTFTELQAFTKDLESRPVERLLRDVADLVKALEPGERRDGVNFIIERLRTQES